MLICHNHPSPSPSPTLLRAAAMLMSLVALAASPAPGADGDAIHSAELVATADTALVEGAQWGDAPAHPLGAVRELALANLPDRRSAVLVRFDLRPLRPARSRRIVRARLGLVALGLSASTAPARIDVLLVHPDFAWEEGALTSDQWHAARRAGRARFDGDGLGDGLFQYEAGQAQWRTLSLDPAPLQAALAAGQDHVTLCLQCAPSMAPGALAVAAREFEGPASAMRLTLWHDGDWLPDLDPDFLPWDSPRTRALAGQTAVGDGALGVAYREAGDGAVGMELFLAARSDEAPPSAGWVDMPCPPLDLDRFELNFRLDPLAISGPTTLTLTLAPLALDGAARVWRRPIAGADAEGDGARAGAPQVFRLGPDDFASDGTPSPNATLRGPALSRPFARWSIETASAAPVRVAIGDFSATAPDPPTPRPSTRGARTEADGTTLPFLIALTPEQLLASAAGPWLAGLEETLSHWGVAVVAQGGDGLIPALAHLPGPPRALETTVAGLTAGALSAGEAWTTFEDGTSPNTARRLSPRGLWSTDAASLLSTATATALAAPARAARQSGADLFILREPVWPRQEGETGLAGGFALWERNRLRDLLAGRSPAMTWLDPAQGRLGERTFLDAFEADYGFRPGPGWFGLVAWDQFVPTFRWSDHPDGALERRRWLLTRAALRFAWLDFVGAAARRGTDAMDGAPFWLALSGDDPRDGADPWNALRRPTVAGAMLRRSLTTPTVTLDEAARTLPLRRREADRLGKGIGLALDPADADERTLFLTAYAWQAAGAGAMTQVDLSALGLEALTARSAGRVQAAWAGGQAARADGARPARRRDILLLGDSPALDGARPFDSESAFPNMAALMARANVDYDYAALPQAPRDLTPWRVVVWNATNMGEPWRDRLRDWLRTDPVRALVCLGAAPSRDGRSDALWADARLTLHPAEVVDRDGAQALGLAGLVRKTLASRVFMIESVLPPYAAHIAPRSLLSPASHSLYDYARPDDVWVPLALEGGFPLISRFRPFSQGGSLVYIHYNMGLPATAQRAFDLAVLRGLLEDLGCPPEITCPGARVVSFVAEGLAQGATAQGRPPVALLIWPEESDGGRTLELAAPGPGEAMAVDAFSGERFEATATPDGRIGFAFAEGGARLLYVGRGADAAALDGAVARLQVWAPRALGPSTSPAEEQD